jgi:hypothetical protein
VHFELFHVPLLAVSSNGITQKHLENCLLLTVCIGGLECVVRRAASVAGRPSVAKRKLSVPTRKQTTVNSSLYPIVAKMEEAAFAHLQAIGQAIEQVVEPTADTKIF